jgi:hypothetical protein
MLVPPVKDGIGLISMLALETRCSGVQPPVSIPSSTTANKILDGPRSTLIRHLHLDTDEDFSAVHPVADEPECEANHSGLQHRFIAAAQYLKNIPAEVHLERSAHPGL